MVFIKFSLDKTDSSDNKGNFDSIIFEYDSSKTIREMLVDFVKQNNDKLKIARSDIDSFASTLNPDLMTFVSKAKILNKEENAKKKVRDIFKHDNCLVKIIDTGSIFGGKKFIYLSYKRKENQL